MAIKSYDDMDGFELDVLKEIGSIGSGNAATALSQMLSMKIRMSLPQVKILDYNKAIRELGGAETIVMGVLVQISGELNGLILYLQDLNFIKKVVKNLIQQDIEDYEDLNDLEMSALLEIGNIMISSYINAISSLTGISINLSVPVTSINMLGAIMSVPMIEYGYETDKLMTIGGTFMCDGDEVYSNLILLLDIKSLDYLLKKLGVESE